MAFYITLCKNVCKDSEFIIATLSLLTHNNYYVQCNNYILSYAFRLPYLSIIIIKTVKHFIIIIHYKIY